MNNSTQGLEKTAVLKTFSQEKEKEECIRLLLTELNFIKGNGMEYVENNR